VLGIRRATHAWADHGIRFHISKLIIHRKAVA
jgi:hypothetical protein